MFEWHMKTHAHQGHQRAVIAPRRVLVSARARVGVNVSVPESSVVRGDARVVAFMRVSACVCSGTDESDTTESVAEEN